MIKKSLTMFLFFFLAFAVSVFGESLHIGDNNRDFLGESAGFNLNTNVTTYLTSTDNHKNAFVFVGNFDNSTGDEIALVNEDGIELYDTTLNLIHTYTRNTAIIDKPVLTTSDVLDIDNDGSYEIVMVMTNSDDTSKYIDTIGWNEGGFTNRTSKLITLGSVLSTDYWIGCDDIRDVCLLAWVANIGNPGCENPGIGVIPLWWNESNNFEFKNFEYDVGGDAYSGEGADALAGYTLHYSITDDRCMYFPTIKSMQVLDYDDNGDADFIFSYLTLYTGTTGDANVAYMGLRDNVNKTPYLIDSSVYDTSINAYSPLPNGGWSNFAGGNPTTRNFSQIISSPLTGQFDSSNTIGFETMLGVANDEGSSDDWEFVIVYFDDQGEHKNEYPEQGLFNLDTEEEGYAISNLVKASIFPSSPPDKDICMAVYSNDEYNMKIICAQQTFDLFGSAEHYTFSLNTSSYWNSYQGSTGDNANAMNYKNQIFAVNSNISTARDEIVTTYGVIDLHTPDADIGIGDQQEANIIYDAYSSDSIIWLDDADDSGYDDLIYFDAPILILQTGDPVKYGCGQNPPGSALNPCITSLIIDPTTLEPILQNSTVHVSGNVEDYDNDDIQVRVRLYVGDQNEQTTGWGENYTSGSTFLKAVNEDGESLIFNKTGTYKMDICARDNDKPTYEYCIIRNPVVSSTEGNSRGEGRQENVNVEIEHVEAGVDITSKPPGDNMFLTTADILAQAGGISVENYMLMIAVLIGISVFVMTITSTGNATTAGGMALAGTTSFILIASVFGLISVVWVIVPITLSIGGYFLFKFIFGRGE